MLIYCLWFVRSGLTNSIYCLFLIKVIHLFSKYHQKQQTIHQPCHNFNRVKLPSIQLTNIKQQNTFLYLSWKQHNHCTITHQHISHFTSHDLHARYLNEENGHEHDKRDEHNKSDRKRKNHQHWLVNTNRWPKKVAFTTQNNNWWLDPLTTFSDTTINHVLMRSGEINHHISE